MWGNYSNEDMRNNDFIPDMVNTTSCYMARKVLIYHFEVPFLQKALTIPSVGMSFAKATTAHLDCEGVSHGPANDFIVHLLKCSKVQIYCCPAIVRGKKRNVKTAKTTFVQLMSRDVFSKHTNV